jgi:hypothetical protein
MTVIFKRGFLIGSMLGFCFLFTQNFIQLSMGTITSPNRSIYLASKGSEGTNLQNFWPDVSYGLKVQTNLIGPNSSWKELKISLCSHENEEEDDSGNSNNDGDNGGNDDDNGGEDNELIET